MAEVVLDASALLALLNDEPGAALVEKELDDALMSSVNVSEVASVLVDVGMPIEVATVVIGDLGLETVPFDDDLAFQAASLRPDTRKAGLSLGDRACLALGSARGLPVLTADRAWAATDLQVDVRLIR